MATDTQTEVLQATGIAPSFTCNDLDKSIGFYTDGLGFTVEHRWEDKGKLVGVMLKGGNARLGISQDDFAKGRDRVKGVGMRVWIETDQDLHELASRAKSAGVKLDHDPVEEYGTLAFSVTDPDGFKVTISNKMTT